MPPSPTFYAHYLMSVGPQGYPKGSGQSKVSQFDGTQLVDEQILGLQVSVNDPMRMAKVYSLQQLEEVALEGEGEGEEQLAERK